MYKLDKIMITGGGGFVGSHLFSALKSQGFQNLIRVGNIHRNNVDIVCDLRICTATRETFSIYQPDVVIHLAATVGGIGANAKEPGRFFFDNMSMGLNVIDTARQFDVKKLVLLSTVCSYPKDTPVPFKEENIWNGYPEPTNAPYGIAKKALMEMLAAYKKQYNLNGICLLPVNLYGPGDTDDPKKSHVIPALIRKFHEAKKNKQKSVTLWGTGSASREFLYVEDCAAAIILALEHYNNAEPVNIGTGQEISIRELANIIATKMGYAGEILFDASKPDGQPRRCLDVSKAKKEFGFEATTSLSDGLDKTIDFFKRKYE